MGNLLSTWQTEGWRAAEEEAAQGENGQAREADEDSATDTEARLGKQKCRMYTQEGRGAGKPLLT